jgi:threonyl-tRNA synthetase
VIIHRSIVSTLERMVAHLLEIHDGALPVWLAPTQVAILPVGAGAPHAQAVRAALVAAGLRAELDERDQTLSARVREAWRLRIPYVAVVGDREAADGSVSVRVRGGEQLGPLTVSAFVGRVANVVARHACDPE